MSNSAAVYAGDGAAIGKWYGSGGGKNVYHLIAGRAERNGWPVWRAACGLRFSPHFEFSPRWAQLGGHQCPKCEAKS